jgi:alanine dehydrogenase
MKPSLCHHGHLHRPVAWRQAIHYLPNPTYIEEEVIHYCVPNMTGIVARTTTHAVNNAAWPYIQEIASKGLNQALTSDRALRHGLNIYDGKIVHPGLRESLGGIG